jgi:hypothetical protein
MSTIDPGVTSRRPHRQRRGKRGQLPQARAPPAGEMPLTLSVPEAGKRYFNLSRNASYAAAKSGQLPTVRIRKLLRVPVRLLERMLDEAGHR